MSLTRRPLCTLCPSRFAQLSLLVSFYEIYGGKLFDLLNARAVVRCLEDGKQQVQKLMTKT
jgi:hypothetical protein